MKVRLSLLVVLFFVFSSFAPLQVLKTSLQLTIMDGIGNYQGDVEVTLYETEEDYKAETNPVQDPKFTDKKGKVTFKELKSQSYYVKAVKGKKNNVGGAEQTAELVEGRKNKANIIIY